MDSQTIGLIFALIGVITTIGYFVLAYMGINVFRDYIDYKKQEQKSDEHTS